MDAWGTTNDTVTSRLAVLESDYTRLERFHGMQQTISGLIAETRTVETLACRILRIICEGAGWDIGELWSVDPDRQVLAWHMTWQPETLALLHFEEISRPLTFEAGIGLPGRVWANQAPLWLPNVLDDNNFLRTAHAAKDGLHTGIGLPIRAHGKLLGVMALFSRVVRLPDAQLLQLLDGIGLQLGLCMTRLQLEEEARQQARREAEAEAQKRLALELHGTAIPPLFSASVTAELLPYLWDHDLGKIWFGLGELRQLTRDSLNRANTLLSILGGANLANVSVAMLLETLTKKVIGPTHLAVDLTVKGDCLLSGDAHIMLYCLIQEALQNVVQHARATRLTINLFTYAQNSELQIIDNGRGFNLNTVLPDRVGLRIMRESAERIQAECEITSTIGSGTQVVVRWKS